MRDREFARSARSAHGRRGSRRCRAVFAPQATSFPFSEKQPTQKNVVFLHVWVTAAPRPNVAAHLRTRHLRASHTESRRLPTDLERAAKMLLELTIRRL